jgi:hypothetical protein
MHKLHNAPFAIVITREVGGSREPVGMYRGNTTVGNDAIRFASLDGKLDLVLGEKWLQTIRSVPEAIAEDLGYADYFITVDASDWTS